MVGQSTESRTAGSRLRMLILELPNSSVRPTFNSVKDSSDVALRQADQASVTESSEELRPAVRPYLVDRIGDEKIFHVGVFGEQDFAGHRLRRYWGLGDE